MEDSTEGPDGTGKSNASATPKRYVPRKVTQAPPPSRVASGTSGWPSPPPRIVPEPRLNPSRNAGLRFPESLTSAIEQACIEAGQEFRNSVGIAPSREQVAQSQRVWFWRVFLAYGRGAHELVRHGTWKASRMVTSGEDFFRLVAEAADIKWSRPEVDAELRHSPEWEQYEEDKSRALKVASPHAEQQTDVKPRHFVDEPVPTGIETKEIRCRRRAASVANVISELSKLKPQMFDDESEYARLEDQYPEFTCFKVAKLRSDLKLKIRSIQGSRRHVRLAQEIVAAQYDRALATIQDDWKRYKPVGHKIGRHSEHQV
jgi:hypothetical protein